jgi:uncharacterized membrane protein SpoIIM required for sporulation
VNQEGFIRLREAAWNEFEGLIRTGKKEMREQAPSFPRRYRELTQDLNTARVQGFDQVIMERLNYLVLEGNQILYGQRPFSPKGIGDFVLGTFPRTVRSQWRLLAVSMAIFYGLGLFFAFFCLRYPNMIYEIIGPELVENLETMYDPQNSRFLIPRDAGADANMFGFYIYNNISIAFRIFAGGILGGIGSLLLLGANGIVLGVSAALIINRGFGSTFFPFVIGHSSFELTAIVLSAQGGLLLGYRLFVTLGLTRSASIKAAGKIAVPLIGGSALMLFIAAVIEAFWSSRYLLPPALRYGAGAAGWALLFLYFLFVGREKRRAEGRTGKEKLPGEKNR